MEFIELGEESVVSLIKCVTLIFILVYCHTKITTSSMLKVRILSMFVISGNICHPTGLTTN